MVNSLVFREMKGHIDYKPVFQLCGILNYEIYNNQNVKIFFTLNITTLFLSCLTEYLSPLLLQPQIMGCAKPLPWPVLGGLAPWLVSRAQTGPSLEGACAGFMAPLKTSPTFCWCLSNRKAKDDSGNGILCLKHAVGQATSGQTVHLPLCSSSDSNSHRWKHWWDFLSSCLVAIWNPHALYAVCWTSTGLLHLISGFLHSTG